MLSNLLSSSSKKLYISSEGYEIHLEDVYLMVFGNGEYFGGGMKVCPGAILNDGLANMTVLHDIGKLYIFSQLSSEMISGNHIWREDKCDYIQTKKLRVESMEGSDFQVELDGDLIGVGPATFSIIPSAIKLYRLHQ